MPRGPFTLREFRRSDFDAIWRIDQACFEPGISYSRAEIAWYVTRKNAFTLVAEQVPPRQRARPSPPQSAAKSPPEPKLVGFIIADRDRRGDGHVTTIDVLPEARRHGLGSDLLLRAEQRLLELGCGAVTLETAVTNTAALSFYQRHHYSIMRTLPGYYQNGVDALLMRKPLG